MSSSPRATVGIVSIGDMGVGIARLLVANDYRVVTNASDRSSYTKERATSASVELLPDDSSLISQCDYILSIVPPRDCLATARRIASAVAATARTQKELLYYLDLNAVSPLTTQKMASEFSSVRDHVCILDGGIIGGPPKLSIPGDATSVKYRPSIVLSGPNPLTNAPVSGANMAEVLKVKHVHSDLGPASGLKMCFASMNKGFVAIAIQAMTTASQLGVLPELQSHLTEYTPELGIAAEKGVVGMCPKAYRWVGEMEEIAETMRVFGGFELQQGKEVGKAKQGDLFGAVSDIYRFVADDTELGKERTEQREKGTSSKEVAEICAANLNLKKNTEN